MDMVVAVLPHQVQNLVIHLGLVADTVAMATLALLPIMDSLEQVEEVVEQDTLVVLELVKVVLDL